MTIGNMGVADTRASRLSLATLHFVGAISLLLYACTRIYQGAPIVFLGSISEESFSLMNFVIAPAWCIYGGFTIRKASESFVRIVTWPLILFTVAVLCITQILAPITNNASYFWYVIPTVVAAYALHRAGAYTVTGLAAVANGIATTNVFGPGKGTASAIAVAALLLSLTMAITMSRAVEERARQGLKAQSEQDPLTGLATRQRLVSTAQHALRTVERMDDQHQSWLFMIDADHFKNLNDTHGHPEGDATLRIIAAVLSEESVGKGIAARYGGDEFAVFLPAASAEQAHDFAACLLERIPRVTRTACEEPVTISIGITHCPPGVSSSELQRRADSALYEAKSSGRNQYAMYRRAAPERADEMSKVGQ